MSQKSIKFGDEKVIKSSFYKNKKPFKAEDINISFFKKEPYGEKSFRYFIAYNDDDVIRPLCISLPQMVAYVKHFKNNSDGDNKTMSFNLIDNKLLKKYNKISQKISSLLTKKFDSDPVYGDNDKYKKTKIKQYRDKINTNFQGKKIPPKKKSYKCLSLIMLESVIKMGKKHYPRTALEECKYELKKKQMQNFINHILIQVHQMNLIMNLRNLIMKNLMDLITKNLMINLLMMSLKVKIVF